YGGAHEIISSELGIGEPLSHGVLQVLVDRGQELLRGLELLPSADEQREVFGHLAALDRLYTHALERLRERRYLRRLVHPPAGGKATGPGEDRGDRVGRSRLALLVLAEVAGDGAVGGLGLDGLSVGTHQDAGHQAERAE